MHDLAAPSFRERNTVADLAVIFAPIRERGTNLEAVAVLQPAMTSPPVIDADGLLRMAGTFETQPAPIRFELAFQVVERSWSLFGIRVVPLEQLASSAPRRGGIPIPSPRPEPSLVR